VWVVASHPEDGKITYMGSRNPEDSMIKFCVLGSVHDVITYTNFDEDWHDEGSNLGFPLTCVVANTILSHYHASVSYLHTVFQNYIYIFKATHTLNSTQCQEASSQTDKYYTKHITESIDLKIKNIL